jgi:sugar-specific transcriptional regulator TrmB
MKNILQNLQQLNFTQYESKAYMSLLKQGDVTGYELAKNSGIPASKIYQVLNKLIAKEVVIVVDSDPARYTPIPPNEVLNRFRKEYIHNLDSLSQSLDKIYKQQEFTDNYIWNITGREAILHRVNEFISLARHSIHLSVWDEEIEHIRTALTVADTQKVQLYIVHYGEERLGFGHEFRHGREHQIRQERGARRIALEVDEERVILGHFLEDGNCTAVWTTNKGLVLLAKDYIIHDIYTIRIAEKFGDAVNQIFESH